MRRLVSLMLLTASAFSTSRAAQCFGPEPTGATKHEVLQLREAAWRTCFATDQDGFTRIVPTELLAIGWDGGPWNDRAETLARTAEFAKGGQVLTTPEFPRTEFQQYGDVVIRCATLRIVLEATDGTLRETKGRGTEVFVRRPGRGWAHTAWHLDKVAT